jgi:hypothetical protein
VRLITPVDHGVIPFGKLRLVEYRLKANSGNSLRESISKIARVKWIWRCGSSSRVPNLQVLSPKFKPIHKTKKHKKIENDLKLKK